VTCYIDVAEFLWLAEQVTGIEAGGPDHVRNAARQSLPRSPDGHAVRAANVEI